jgi:hypothetical protein
MLREGAASSTHRAIGVYWIVRRSLSSGRHFGPDPLADDDNLNVRA